MAFTAKDWRNFPETSTPVTAEALEDLEVRVTDHTDARVVDEVLHVRHVAQDNGLTFDNTGITNMQGVISQAITTANAAPAARRKAVLLEPGVYYCTSPIGTLPTSVALIGGDAENWKTTTISFRNPSDGGQTNHLGGSVGIDIPDSSGRLPVLQGLTIQGTDAAHIPIQAAPPTTHGTGVRVRSSSHVYSCRIKGFCYGLDIRGSHNSIHKTNFGESWAGAYFGPRDPIQADGIFFECNFDSMRWTGIACHPSHYVGAYAFIENHFAGSAYAIWKMADSYWDGTGQGLNGLIVGGCVFIDSAFESIANAIIAHEELGKGAVEDTSFIRCDSSGNGYGLVNTPEAAIKCSTISRCSWINSPLFWYGGYTTAAIIAARLTQVDFGDVFPQTLTEGKPFAVNGGQADFASPSMKGVRARVDGYNAVLARATTTMNPGDIVRHEWAHTTYGPVVKANETTNRRILGVSRSSAMVGDGSQAVVVQNEGVTQANVAPTAVVATTAAVGATTLTVNNTAVFGSNGTSVTLVNSGGTTVASGTVASGTTFTVTALGSQILKGTQVWAARTVGAQVTNSQWVRPRWGSAQGSSTNNSIGQVIGAANVTGADTPSIGQADPNGDNGRVVDIGLGIGPG